MSEVQCPKCGGPADTVGGATVDGAPVVIHQCRVCTTGCALDGGVLSPVVTAYTWAVRADGSTVVDSDVLPLPPDVA